MKPAERELLLEGVERFNRGEFWDAHESWEAIWLEASDPTKRFLQGLIQLAAAYHHFKRGTLAGGVRLVDAAERKLEAPAEPGLGIVVDDALAQARDAREWARRQLENDTTEPISPTRFPSLRVEDDESATKR